MNSKMPSGLTSRITCGEPGSRLRRIMSPILQMGWYCPALQDSKRSDRRRPLDRQNESLALPGMPTAPTSVDRHGAARVREEKRKRVANVAIRHLRSKTRETL